MRRKEFKITGKRDFDVVAENFTSTAEVIAVTRTRPPCDESWKNRRDYLNETWDNGQEPPGHGWEGFSGKEEFEELIHLGVRDTSMLKDVRKYSAKATVKEKDKLAVQCRDVVGGGVDVPTFLTGNPQCMYALKRKKVKSKIIEIGIECGLTCDYSVNQYKKAGMALTKVVAKLENGDTVIFDRVNREAIVYYKAPGAELPGTGDATVIVLAVIALLAMSAAVVFVHRKSH